MKDRFSVARCCCEQFCEDCCNGNAPTEWDVDLQYTDQVCTACNEDASGIFTVARSGGICRWYFRRTKSTGWNPPCAADYSTYGNEFFLQDIVVDVRCINTEEYRVRVAIDLEARYDTGVEYNTQLGSGNPPKLPGQAITTRNFRRGLAAYYSRIIRFDEFTCDEAVDFELSFVQAETFVSFEWLYTSLQWTGYLSTSYFRTFYTLPVPKQNYPVYAGGVNPDWFIDVDTSCQPPATIKITGVP